MRWLATMLLACGLAAPLLAQPASPSTAPNAAAAIPLSVPAPPRPVFTRQNQFSIPFSFPPASDPALAPKEVRLFVSVDRGTTWTLLQTAKPDAKAIPVRAPSDGEYWFSLRTVDPGGKLLPAAPPRAELIVIVDSSQPSLELTLSLGTDGQVTANWRAADANLSAGSLKISYQSADGTWRDVALPRPANADSMTAEGAVTWRDGGTSLVRAEIQDAAGNPAVTQAPPEAAASTPSVAGRPSQTEDAANGSSSGWRSKPPAVRDASASRTTDTVSGVRNPWLTDPIKPPQQRTASASANQLQTGLPWNQPSGAASPPWYTPAAAMNAADASPDQPPGDASMTSIRKKRRNEKDTTAGERQRANPAPSQDATSREQASSTPGAAVPRQPWLVNSRWVGLNYQSDVPADKLNAVEVWVTRDQGQTWRRLAADDDKQSPITARFDDEGLYGLRLLVQKHGGAEFPPGRGDVPELWLAVDRSPPECRLTSAEEGVRGEYRQLSIDWRASDAAIAGEASDDATLQPELSITLQYAAHPAGPWTTIAAGIPNTGRHAWQMPHHAPDQVYLKLQAHDAAGNVGEYVADQPVTPRRPAVGSRIQTIQPQPEKAGFETRNSQ